MVDQAYFNGLDVRLEYLIASLTNEEISTADILVNYNGGFKRNYSNDIESFQFEPTETDDSSVLKVEINRNGFYDHIPEGVFHQVKTVEEIDPEYLKKQKEHEYHARSFFYPFEQVLMQTRALAWEGILQNERDTNELMSELWQHATHEDTYPFPEDGGKVMQCLALAPYVVGDIYQTQQLLKEVLATEVQISLTNKPKSSIPATSFAALGDGKLGMDSLLTGALWEGIPSMVVEVGPVATEYISSYLPGGQNFHLLERVLPALCPMESEISFQVKAAPGGTGFCLGSTESAAFLGYSTLLPFSENISA